MDDLRGSLIKSQEMGLISVSVIQLYEVDIPDPVYLLIYKRVSTDIATLF